MSSIERIWRSTACILGLACIQGCAAWVNVERYVHPEPNAKDPGQVGASTQEGFRYFLPEPYLLMKPKADGTATYEWVFLPDRRNEYVVAPRSFFATYKMEVKTENGFLTSATFDGTADDVAGKLATAAGDVKTAQINAADEAQKAADKKAQDKATAEQTKATADQTAYNTKLTAAQKALADSELTQKLADADVAFYQSDEGKGVKDDVKLAANLAKKRADATVLLMRERLNDVVSSAPPVSSGVGAMDSPRSAVGPMTAAGAVLFKLVQTATSVTLKQVNIQHEFETSGAASQGSTAPTADSVSLTSPKVSQNSGKTVVEFSSSASINITTTSALILNRGTDAVTNSKATYAKGAADKQHKVTFEPALLAGDYTLVVQYTAENAAQLKFKVP